MLQGHCYCHSGESFALCCQKTMHEGATSAQALMRSRYSAFYLKDSAYIFDTEASQLHENMTQKQLLEMLKKQHYISLEIVDAKETKKSAYVSFQAMYIEENVLVTLNETSSFSCDKGKWLYNEAIKMDVQERTISNKELCPCGSKKKFKHCCAKGK